jgi:hypothetical protein
VQADTVTVNLHYSQTQEGHSTEDNLFGHKIFSGPHFLTMALYVFCDQSQKLTAPPPPPRTRPPPGRPAPAAGGGGRSVFVTGHKKHTGP